MFGNPEVTPGGRALKFYSSIRIEVRKSENIKIGDTIIGNKTKAKIAKNKIAPPFKVAEFDIIFGKGISKEGCLVDVGVECGAIDKAGAWYSYKDQRIGQGRENAKDFLLQNPTVAQDIEKVIRTSFNLDKKPEEKVDTKKDE